MNIVTVVTKILLYFRMGFPFYEKLLINLKKDRFSTAAKLDVLSIFQNPTILQIIHYRWVRQDCFHKPAIRLTQLLRKPLYDRITIAEFLILWMMCFACHIMSFFAIIS